MYPKKRAGEPEPVVFDILELEPAFQKPGAEAGAGPKKETRSRSLSRQKCAAPVRLWLLKVKSRRILNIYFFFTTKKNCKLVPCGVFFI